MFESQPHELESAIHDAPGKIAGNLMTSQFSRNKQAGTFLGLNRQACLSAPSLDANGHIQDENARRTLCKS